MKLISEEAWMMLAAIAFGSAHMAMSPDTAETTTLIFLFYLVLKNLSK